jgi:hypothetical protein
VIESGYKVSLYGRLILYQYSGKNITIFLNSFATLIGCIIEVLIFLDIPYEDLVVRTNMLLNEDILHAFLGTNSSRIAKNMSYSAGYKQIHMSKTLVGSDRKEEREWSGRSSGRLRYCSCS